MARNPVAEQVSAVSSGRSFFRDNFDYPEIRDNQSLSIAGNRAGLKGARSGLFLEQIRIVRELREAERRRGRTGIFIRPRFMLWENVPGAFSSNKGRDFQTVLTECVRIAEPSAPDVPPPDKGRWTKAGVLVGDGFSVAWRVLDAQYWGVPQRRRRIVLVCDFGGECAGEILFKRESVPGRFTEGGRPGQSDSGAVAECAYPAVARTLSARHDGSPCMDRGPNIVVQSAAFCIQGNVIAWDAKMNGSGISGEPMFTLNTVDRHAVYDARGNGDGKTVCTMTSSNIEHLGDYTPIITDCTAEAAAVDCRAGTEGTVNGTLQAKESGANNVVRQGNRVRLLTPLECERWNANVCRAFRTDTRTSGRGRTAKDGGGNVPIPLCGATTAHKQRYWNTTSRNTTTYTRP